MKIRKLLIENVKRVPKSGLFASLCESYLDHYNDYSCDFQVNGEEELLKNLSKLDFKMVFDVGSNIGEWAQIAHGCWKGSPIHCFELSRKTFQTLRENLGDAGAVYTLNNKGLSSSPGTIEYKDYGTDSGHNTLVLGADFHDHYNPATLVSAEVSTGDIYCAEHEIKEIDFLKIDVEGAESQVLQGFSGMFGRRAVRVVQFEYGYTNGDAKFLMRDFYEFFQNNGYKVGKVRKGGVRFSPWSYQDNDFKSGPNYVAVREDDEELISAVSSR